MKNKFIVLALVAIVTFTGFSSEKGRVRVNRSKMDGIPMKVLSGLQSLKKDQVPPAISTWASISISPNKFIDDVSQSLQASHSNYGPFLGYEFVKIHSITKSYHKIFMLLKYEKSPIIIQFDTYQANDEEEFKILFIKIHNNLHKTLPPEIEDSAN
jgi:hypothetical protein